MNAMNNGSGEPGTVLSAREHVVTSETSEETSSAAPPAAPGPTPATPMDWSPRRLLVVGLVAVIVGAALGYAGAALWPKQYVSRADILFAITKEEPTEFLREDRKLTTQVVLITSRAVLAPVAAASGLPVEDLEQRVSAEVVPGSQLLEVEVRDRSPERGLALTQQIVARYTAVADTQPGNPARDYLEGELAQVRQRLAVARAASSTSATAAEVPSLADRERSLSDQLDTVAVDELTSTRPQLAVAPYTLAAPAGPSAVVGAVAGGLVVLLVIAGLLVAVSMRRRARGGGP